MNDAELLEHVRRVAHNDAQADPRVIAAKNENQRLVLQAQLDFAFQQIFSTFVDFPDGKKVPVDNEANRLEIPKWANPGEQINNPREWFVRVLKESPSLAGRISWTKYLTPQQRKAQADKDAQARRVQALAKCREYNLSECESNLHVLTNHDGIVVWVANGPTLMTDVVDEGELALVAASQAELEKYAQEKRDQHQNYLRELSAKGDIAGLRAASVQERLEKSQNTQTLYRDFRLIKGFAERQEYLLEGPLPDRWNGRELDANFIRQSTRELLTPIIRKFGGARVDARLFGLDESFFSDWQTKLRTLEYQLTGVKGSSH